MMTFEQKKQFSNEYEAARRNTLTKVWNKDEYEYRQPFEEKLIVIPAGEYIMMTYNEAKRFKLSDPMPGKNHIDPERLKLVVKMIKVDEPTREEVLNNMKKNSSLDYDTFYKDMVKPTEDKYIVNETNPKSDLISCPVCSKQFDTPNGLAHHILKSCGKAKKE